MSTRQRLSRTFEPDYRKVMKPTGEKGVTVEVEGGQVQIGWKKRPELLPPTFTDQPCALCRRPMQVGIGQIAKYHGECKAVMKQGKHAVERYLRAIIRKAEEAQISREESVPSPVSFTRPEAELSAAATIDNNPVSA